jgi:hypothetical protein
MRDFCRPRECGDPAPGLIFTPRFRVLARNDTEGGQVLHLMSSDSIGDPVKNEFQKKFIVLLIGGDKRSQVRDIEKAKRYWSECMDLLYD